MSCRQFYDFRYLGTDFAFGDIINKLFENLHTLFYFLQTKQITGETVAGTFGVDYLIEFKFVIY